jgi:hypothetical protein
MPPLISRVIRDLSRYSVHDMGTGVKSVYDALAKSKDLNWSHLGTYLTGDYSVHKTGPTPKNLVSMIEKGLEARGASGGQPPLLFSWNSMNDAGLIPRRSVIPGYEYKPEAANSEILNFLIKNSGDTSMSRGGVPGSLTTRRTVPPEDMAILDPTSFGGKPIPKRWMEKIPPEMLIKMEQIKADDILEQLFIRELMK